MASREEWLPDGPGGGPAACSHKAPPGLSSAADVPSQAVT